MGFRFEENLVNEAQMVATMLDWSNAKNDPQIEKWTQLLRNLAGTVKDQIDIIKHMDERIEELERQLAKAENRDVNEIACVKEG